MRWRGAALLLMGIVLAAASLFFCYYTLRLLYVNLLVPGVASRRGAGMLIGAIAFPLATIVFGWLSARSFTVARRCM